MGLINDLKTGTNFTEREETIRDYILANPEKIKDMSTKQLGESTLSSAASISRFCKKLGCNSYSDFKIRFFGELKKRYGFIYVDKNDDGTGDGKRYKKKSFEWYKHVIETNGEEL